MYHSNDQLHSHKVRRICFADRGVNIRKCSIYKSITVHVTDVPMFTTGPNRDLYGPSRISARTGIKDVMLRDHVLQEGEWYSEENNPWKTSLSISFEVGALATFFFFSAG